MALFHEKKTQKFQFWQKARVVLTLLSSPFLGILAGAALAIHTLWQRASHRGKKEVLEKPQIIAPTLQAETIPETPPKPVLKVEEELGPSPENYTPILSGVDSASSTDSSTSDEQEDSFDGQRFFKQNNRIVRHVSISDISDDDSKVINFTTIREYSYQFYQKISHYNNNLDDMKKALDQAIIDFQERYGTANPKILDQLTQQLQKEMNIALESKRLVILKEFDTFFARKSIADWKSHQPCSIENFLVHLQSIAQKIQQKSSDLIEKVYALEDKPARPGDKLKYYDTHYCRVKMIAKQDNELKHLAQAIHSVEGLSKPQYFLCNTLLTEVNKIIEQVGSLEKQVPFKESAIRAYFVRQEKWANSRIAEEFVKAGNKSELQFLKRFVEGWLQEKVKKTLNQVKPAVILVEQYKADPSKGAPIVAKLNILIRTSKFPDLFAQAKLEIQKASLAARFLGGMRKEFSDKKPSQTLDLHPKR